MISLIPVETSQDILQEYRGTPIGLLLEYHNLHRPLDAYTNAQLLIGMCIDHRKLLRLPQNFAYVIRSGGANLRYSEFMVSFAIAVGGVQAVALIGHTQCGMMNLSTRRQLFIHGLIERAGWTEEQAAEHFLQSAPKFEIGNVEEFIVSEASRFRQMYPKVIVAPLLYRVEDNRLYQLEG